MYSPTRGGGGEPEPQPQEAPAIDVSQEQK